jgi:hypothetical protein
VSGPDANNAFVVPCGVRQGQLQDSVAVLESGGVSFCDM